PVQRLVDLTAPLEESDGLVRLMKAVVDPAEPRQGLPESDLCVGVPGLPFPSLGESSNPCLKFLFLLRQLLRIGTRLSERGVQRVGAKIPKADLVLLGDFMEAIERLKFLAESTPVCRQFLRVPRGLERRPQRVLTKIREADRVCIGDEMQLAQFQ